MLFEIQTCFQEKNYKGLFRCLKSVFPSKLMSNIMFFSHYHRKIDYANPTILDEKLLVLKDELYRDNELIIKCTDKYAVREYIVEKGEEEILNPLIGVYSSTEEINWEMLPQKCAIKCNHGCGYNIIIDNKDKYNKQDVFDKLEHWMKEDYSIISAELHYKTIPHKIIIEKYIETKDGSLPVDYKFFCSRGNVICVLIYTGRGKSVERIYVDDEFRDLKYIEEYTGDNYESLKPSSFSVMVQIAKKLSEDFPFVRVDLYESNGKVIFGELTFTPHGCYHDYLSEVIQKKIGEKIKL